MRGQVQRERRRRGGEVGEGQPQEPVDVPEMTPIFGSLFVGPRSSNTADGIPPMSENHRVSNRLWVQGGIVVEDLFMVRSDNWADDVFDEDYPLMPLEQLNQYVTTHKHLPGVPTEASVSRDGYGVQNMISTLLRKVEELSLHAIRQDEKIRSLEERLAQTERSVEELNS